MNTLTTTSPKQITLIEPQQPQLAVLPGDRAGKVALVNLAAIYLSRLIKLPIERITYLERLGRVVVVSYQPHGKSDPVLPIPLLDLGSKFFERFSVFALHFQEWRAGAHGEEQRRWLTEAHKRLEAVIGVLAEEPQILSQKEQQYLMYHLALSVARPGRSR